MVIDFKEKGRGGERERNKHRCDKGTSIGCPPLHVPSGD